MPSSVAMVKRCGSRETIRFGSPTSASIAVENDCAAVAAAQQRWERG